MTEHDKQKRLAPLRLLESYWQGLAGETGEIPLRSHIDPRGIESALECAFLAERIAPTLAKLRVAGSHLNDLMGMETGGMPLSALFAADARETLGDAVSRVFGEGAAVRMDLRGEAGLGRNDLIGHMLLLPLRSDMGDMTRMIGVLTTTGRIGRTPRRFTIDTVDIRPAIAMPIKGASFTTGDDRTKPRLTDLAEPAAPFAPKAPAGPAPRSRGHLRLVIDNDED